MALDRSDEDPADYAPRKQLLAVLAAAQGVATDTVARRVMAAGLSGPDVGAAIHAARVDAVAALDAKPNPDPAR
jgi:tRNA nucleotidyltransferase (CCA-adding enzyme)